MISIIIPAHNEESVIARSVKALLAGAREGELEILVICNGCTDCTAGIVRGLGESVRLIETEIASKVHALNLGDQAATGWPRFFVDADVVLPLNVIRKLAARLTEGQSEGGVLAVAPRFRMELDGCSWPVRAFYDIHQRLPSTREGIGGSGVYGLSKAGRSRFETFPNLTADDGFVRVHFRPHERATLDDCWSTVFAPRTLRELIAIKTRSHFGSRELRLRMPDLWANRGPGNAGALKGLCMRPWLWPKLAAYGYVKILARSRASRRLKSGQYTPWDRDASSRLIKSA